jgi:hypothetical protein
MVLIFPWYVEAVESIVENVPGPISNLFSTGGEGEALAGNVDPLIMMKIAAGHSIFNVTNNLFFLPLLPLLVRLVIWLHPDKGRTYKKRSAWCYCSFSSRLGSFRPIHS